MTQDPKSCLPGDALRYHAQVDLSNPNSTHAQLILLTGEDKAVLEIGPATGYLTEILQQRKCRVTAIEADPLVAEQAKKFCERMIVSDVEQLDFTKAFPQERFDVVLCGDILEHLVYPKRLLTAIAQLISPGGYIVASLPNIAHGSIRVALLAGEFPYTDKGLLDRTHLRFFTRGGIEQLFYESGYSIQMWQQIMVDPFATELELYEFAFPASLVAALREDSDALTYQYVVKAIPRKHESVVQHSPVTMQGSPIVDALLRQEHRLAQLESRIAGIERMLSWRLLQWFRRIRDRVMPPGSRGAKAYGLLKRAIEILVDEGIRTYAIKTVSTLHRDLQREVVQIPNVYRVEREPTASVTALTACEDPSIDVVVVTYNSSKWVERCYASLASSSYDHQKISVYFIDNCSTDNTAEVLDGLSATPFKDLFVMRNAKNVGYGAAINRAAACGSAEYIFVLNPDTEIHSECLMRLMEAAARDDRASIWEARQLPYEHPKFYCPLTLETTWTSGAAFLIRRKMFETVEGFEESFFLYTEDVDLSFKLRNHGSVCRYVPKAVVWHYTYLTPFKVKPLQQFYSIRNHLLLRYRYGKARDIIAQYLLCLELFLMGDNWTKKGTTLMLQILWSHLLLVPRMIAWRWTRLNADRFLTYGFFGWDYELTRSGSFYQHALPRVNCLISVIVRTCNRPAFLKEALRSIANQTYTNIEVVIVEDGSAAAEAVIEEFQGILRVTYYPTRDHVGRSRAGNKGLDLCKGEYIGFLDDDDLYYPDHSEILISALTENAQHRAAYSASFEARFEGQPELGNLKTVELIPFFRPFSRAELRTTNFIPIQAMLFHRSLYEECGGFDAGLEALEDWDLWLRYADRTDFLSIPKTTSEFRTPADAEQAAKRWKLFDAYRPLVMAKHRKIRKSPVERPGRMAT